MRKRRWIAGLLAGLLLVAGGCAAETTSPADNQEIITEAETPSEPSAAEETTSQADGRWEAYQAKVQSLADQYGILSEEDGLAWVETVGTTGLLEARTVDVTRDGRDELVCIWLNGTGIVSAVFEYVNGEVTETWSQQADGTGYYLFGMYQAGDAVCWEITQYRNFPLDLYTYAEGSYQSALEQGDLTEQELARIAQRAQEGGSQGEREAMLAVYAARLGLPEYTYEDRLVSVYGDTSLYTAPDLVDLWQLKLPKEMVSAQDVLQDLAYVGDRSKCRMDSAMAQAYADAINSLNPQEGEFPLYVTLADPAGDGMPILITAYLNKNVDRSALELCNDTKYGEIGFIPVDDDSYKEPITFWQYQDGTAEPLDIETTLYTTGFGTMNGQAAYRSIQFYHDAGHNRRAKYYTIQNGQITLVRTIEFLDIEKYDSGDGQVTMYGEVPDGADYQYDDEQALQEHGWQQEDYGWWLVLDNGKNISEQTEWPTDSQDDIAHFEETLELAHINDGEYHYLLDSTEAKGAAALLTAYADAAGRPSYDFPEVSHRFPDEELHQMAGLFADAVTGELGEVYQIGDDLFYLVLYADGKVSGCATVKQTSDGFRLVNTAPEPAAEDALRQLVQEDQQTPNITLDYNDAGEDKTAYLQDALEKIDGTTVNDAAKGEIATYIETAVSDASVTQVKCRRNKAAITGQDVQASLAQAQAQQQELKNVMGETVLNKELIILLRIVCTGLEEGQPVQVTFEPSMLEAMGEATSLQIMLGDAQHSVSITAEDLFLLCQQHGQLTVQLQLQDGKYAICFLDGEETEVAHLDRGLTFTLPAESAMATILASYAEGTDNWGGQFDAINGTLEFSTPYSGTYEVMENGAEIPDIANCEEEMAEAIQFMVSKGYFSLDEAGNFAPDAPLNRYAFAQALVRMFFALDRSLTTTFTDVPQDSPYYPYVASGEKDDIIAGFEDGTFRGDNDVLREEMLALCSRTLADKKGYTYPDAPASYLIFTDREAISDWAEDTTALAVREGLLASNGTLSPREAVSRGEAALMLYRLFMLLYEPPAAAMDFSGLEDDGPSGALIGIGVFAVALVGGAAWGIWRKKTHPPVTAAPEEKSATDEAILAEEPSDSQTQYLAATPDEGPDEQDREDACKPT